MPDPTPLSPLAGIEQNITDSAQWFSRHAAVNASRIATRHAETLAHAADYLAGLGKVLAEIPKPLAEYHALELSEYGRHCERFVAQLRTHLTSPRETGKEKE